MKNKSICVHDICVHNICVHDIFDLVIFPDISISINDIYYCIPVFNVHMYVAFSTSLGKYKHQ